MEQPCVTLMCFFAGESWSFTSRLRLEVPGCMDIATVCLDETGTPLPMVPPRQRDTSTTMNQQHSTNSKASKKNELQAELLPTELPRQLQLAQFTCKSPIQIQGKARQVSQVNSKREGRGKDANIMYMYV